MTTDQLRAEAKRLCGEKKFREAYETCNRVIAGSDNPLGEDFCQRAYYGSQCTPQVDPEKLIEDYTEAIRLGYCVADSHHNRGCLFDNLRETDEALKDYTAAIRLDSRKSIFYRNRGRTYYHKKSDFVKAILDFSEAIRLRDEERGVCQFQRGMCYVATGKLKRAALDFTRAMVFRPPNCGFYSAMDCLKQRAEAYVSRFRFDKALPDLKAILAATPIPVPAERETAIDVETWKSLQLPLLRLRIGTSVVLCPKALMREFRNLDEWTAPQPELEIDQEVLFKMLTGQPQDLSEIRLVDYYSLFEELGLHRFMYVVCKAVEEMTDLRRILRMLCSASKRLRPAVSEDLLFEVKDDFSGCPFCQSCLNVLKAHAAAIRQDTGGLVPACGRLDVLRLLDDSRFLIRRIPPFQYGDDAPTTFVSLFRGQLRELAVEDPKPLSNVVLCTTDGAEVQSYLGLLMCRSKFFARLMNFDGKEKATFLESGRIHLEGLSHSDLLELLHWIYRYKVDSSASLQSCLRLLQFAAMHLEADMTAAFRLAVLDRIEVIPRAVLARVVMETASSVLDLPTEPYDLSRLVKIAFAARLGLSDDGLDIIETILDFSRDVPSSPVSLKEEEE